MKEPKFKGHLNVRPSAGNGYIDLVEHYEAVEKIGGLWVYGDGATAKINGKCKEEKTNL